MAFPFNKYPFFKVKGLTVNNKPVEGRLGLSGDIITDEKDVWHSVNPDTVVVATGFVDGEGNDVYTYDILRDENGKDVGRVEFNPQFAAFVINLTEGLTIDVTNEGVEHRAIVTKHRYMLLSPAACLRYHVVANMRCEPPADHGDDEDIPF